MMVLDQRQQKILDDMELEILDYAASSSEPEDLDALKEELAHFGFTLGSA